jgi:hypothetical protein
MASNSHLHRSCVERKTTLLLIAFITIYISITIQSVDGLYYDGKESYSIYPRLDLHLCTNSSLTFDFTVSTNSTNGYGALNHIDDTKDRLLVYAEQQVKLGSNHNLANTYFLIRLINGNQLYLTDFWSINDIVINLPSDYLTAWFRFTYVRTETFVDITLYKFEITDGLTAFPRLVNVFSKQIVHSNYIHESDDNDDQYSVTKYSLPETKATNSFSQLLVGGISNQFKTTSTTTDKSSQFSGLKPYYIHLRQLSNFHGYLMNLQYTTYDSQCGESFEENTCGRVRRQYATFSSSSSKQQYSNSNKAAYSSVIVDDICESDTLTHDICPRDCSCLSNNFVSPYFNCDCSQTFAFDHSTNSNDANDNSIPKPEQHQCSILAKSFTLNLDDVNYFGGPQTSFDYPILPSFTKVNIDTSAIQFSKKKGIEFHSIASHLYLTPTTSEIQESNLCFWDIDHCSNGNLVVFYFFLFFFIFLNLNSKKKRFYSTHDHLNRSLGRD